MSCGISGRLVGPVRALAQAFTLPAISIPMRPVGRDLKAYPSALHARTCLPSVNSAATRAGNPPTWPPKMRGKHLGLALIGAIVDEDAGASLGPRAESPSHLPTRTKLRPSRLISP